MKTEKTKVYAAMSGGVDSSVAAALLKKQGFDVTGVFFKPWSPENGKAFCNWKEDRQDALSAAAKLGIKFKTWDFSKEYGDKVTKYMIDSYRAGITPNPDVMCNKEIKFKVFLQKALAEGADMIATGHYARIHRKIPKSKLQITNKYQTPIFKLLKGSDSNKDQSYFLYTLTQNELKHCLFPVGEYPKPEVRKLAKKFGLGNHAKKDSQGVCFVGQLDMKQFLKNYIKPKAGEIILKETGEVIGKHDGIFYYTIGQRHGLDLKIGGGPYFITGKNIKKNIIYVSRNENELNLRELLAKNITWVNSAPKLPLNISVQIRYRGVQIPATLIKKAGKLLVKFKKTARAVTSGQSVVFYKGNQVLGGGIII
jgi:tRNA-specific 2-thiouridylase